MPIDKVELAVWFSIATAILFLLWCAFVAFVRFFWNSTFVVHEGIFVKISHSTGREFGMVDVESSFRTEVAFSDRSYHFYKKVKVRGRCSYGDRAELICSHGQHILKKA